MKEKFTFEFIPPPGVELKFSFTPTTILHIPHVPVKILKVKDWISSKSFKITSGGNVGIGTIMPSAEFSISSSKYYEKPVNENFYKTIHINLDNIKKKHKE